VLIGGGPGAGKTRLGEQALELGLEKGMLPLVGHVYEKNGAPFITATEILEEIARVLDTGSLRHVLGGTAPEIARLLPELRRRFPDIPKPLDLPPEQQQRYLFNAVLEFLTRLGAGTPLVIMLDDLHWADESSIALLEHFAPHLPRLPVMMIVTYRDVDADMTPSFKRALSLLASQSYVRLIPLRHLGRDEVADLLSELGGPNPPVEVVDLIFRETEGNPFFVQSVYQHLAEEGRLFDADGQWLYGLDEEALPVPEGVRLVIQHRLDRLAEETVKTLTRAAVVGLRFDIGFLSDTDIMPTEALLDAIEEAETAKLIFPATGPEVETATDRVESRYEFTHTLIRQTLLENLSLPRQQGLDLAVAESMEARWGDNPNRAADIAHHLYRAGNAADPAKTLLFLKLAADRAIEASAPMQAVQHYERALSLLPWHQDLERAWLLLQCGSVRSSENWIRADADLSAALVIYRKHDCKAESSEIMLRLCYVYANTGRVDESLALAEDGLRLVGEEESLARCHLLSAMGLAYTIAGRVTEGSEIHLEAMRLAESLGDPKLLAEVLRNRAYCGFSSLEPNSMISNGREAVDLNRAGEQPWELASSLLWYQAGLSLTGQFDLARETAVEVRELTAVYGDSNSEMMNEVFNGILHQAAGDLDAACRSAGRAQDIAVAAGLAWVGHFAGWHAYLQLQSGDWDGACINAELSRSNLATGTNWDFGDHAYSLLIMAYLDPKEAEAIWNELEPQLPEQIEDAPGGRLQLLLVAPEALCLMGRVQTAGQLYCRVREALNSGRLVNLFGVGLLAKCAGIAAAAAHEYDAAQEHFEAALKLADELPYVTEQGEVRSWFARMLQDRNSPGDTKRARELCSEAAAVYERCGMTRHAQRIKFPG
jgi:tetratricopeptide (TPR) repeat protein